MDSISNLPDGIIIHILSFLPTEEAASTSLLSKRWRDKFAFSPNLQFSTNEMKPPQSFIDFVDRVLAVSGNSAIRRFTLKGRGSPGWSPHINRWIGNVRNRGTLLDLDLDVNLQDSLFLEVLACKTLKNLKLNRTRIPMFPEDASLPALKSLCLSLVSFENLGAFEKFVSACPLLEELICNDINEWSFIKSAPALKRLTLTFFYDPMSRTSRYGSLSFDYPNLVYLKFSGYIQLQYPVVNLGSLVEATVTLVDGNHANSDPSDFIKGLRNVKKLNLAAPKTLGLFGIFREAVPVFENLSHLSITSGGEYCSFVSALSFLLKKSPNIHTLIIDGLLCYDNGCECFLECSRPLKVLELTQYKGRIRYLEQMKRLLEDLSHLELVKVRAFAGNDKEMMSLLKDLLMLPRASSKCKIQIQVQLP